MMGNDLRYGVKRCPTDFVPDADWDGPHWRGVPSVHVDRYVWDAGGFKPTTLARVQYSRDYLYVIFRVEDRYVRCVETQYCGKVYEDSCAEFFFSPDPASASGYFNIETNCGGTVLFHHQAARERNVRQIDPADARLLQIAHSMPSVVDPEIEGSVTWTLGYRIPLAMLARYTAVLTPGPGRTWKANFYKCAETNSHPHWGSWAPITAPAPDFHRPEYFAPIVFE